MTALTLTPEEIQELSDALDWITKNVRLLKKNRNLDVGKIKMEMTNDLDSMRKIVEKLEE